MSCDASVNRKDAPKFFPHPNKQMRVASHKNSHTFTLVYLRKQKPNIKPTQPIKKPKRNNRKALITFQKRLRLRN